MQLDNLYEKVKDILLSLPVRKKKAGKNIFIVCPFHPDSDPSCAINVGNYSIPPGVFYCFGCGAHGNWNKIADALGVQKFSKVENEFIKNVIVKAKINDAKQDFVRYRPPSTLVDIPENFTYLGKLPVQLLKRFGAKIFYDPVVEERRLWFPVYVLTELLGHITLPLNPEVSRVKKPRYSPGNWVTKALWPYDYLPPSIRVLALVEGVKDALNLLKVGIPALANLGSTSVWTSYKKELVLAKNARILILLPDGDKTGVKLGKTWKSDFRKLTKTVWIRLKDGKDPFDLSDTLLRKLCRFLEKEVSLERLK